MKSSQPMFQLIHGFSGVKIQRGAADRGGRVIKEVLYFLSFYGFLLPSVTPTFFFLF